MFIRCFVNATFVMLALLYFASFGFPKSLVYLGSLVGVSIVGQLLYGDLADDVL